MEFINRCQLESAKFALHAKKLELDAIKKEVKKAEAAVHEARVAFEKVKPVYDAGHKFIADLRFDLALLNTKIVELEARIKIEENGDAAAKGVNFRRNVAKLQLELNDLRKSVIEKNIAMYDKEEELESMKPADEVEMVGLQGRLDTANDKSTLLGEEYEKLEEAFDLKWPGVDRSLKELADADWVAEKKALHRQLEALKDGATEKAKTSARLSGELNRVNEQLNQNTEIADTEKKDLSAEIVVLQTTVEKLKKEISIADAAVEKKVAEKEELTTKLINNNSKIEDLTAALDDYKAQVAKLSHRKPDIVVAQSDLTVVADLEAKLSFERTCNDQERLKNQALQAQISRLEGLVDQKEKEKKSIEAKLEKVEAMEVVEIKADEIKSETANSEATPDIETTTTTTTEVQDLKLKIEQMTPLYEIGKLVRVRKFEMCLPKSLQNSAAAKAGWEIAFSGAALADSTLFADFAINPYDGKFVFANRYGVGAAVVWENRGFTKMLDVLNMKLSMDTDNLNNPRFGAARVSFVTECNNFLRLVVPHTTVTTDEQVEADEGLKNAFDKLKEQYEKACEQYEQNKSRKFSVAK